MTYRRCLLHMSIDVVRARGGEKAATVLKRKAKQYFGVGNMDGLSDAEQIAKMNQFWKQTLESFPNTTFIRAWLVPAGTLEEYITLFYQNWCNDVIASGVLRE